MKQFRSMAYPYVAWITVLVVLPMLLIIAYAFTVEGTAFFQGQFTLANLRHLGRGRSALRLLVAMRDRIDFIWHHTYLAFRLNLSAFILEDNCSKHKGIYHSEQ